MIEIIDGQEYKRCSTCGELKPVSSFGKRKATHDGLYGSCKDCTNAEQKRFREVNPERYKKYKEKDYWKHKEKRLANSTKWHYDNIDLVRSRKKEAYLEDRANILGRVKRYRDENGDKCRAASKKWRLENIERSREWYREYVKKRARLDPAFKISRYLRARMSKAIINQKAYKSNKTFELIGATSDFVREHLESQFKPGMTWDNYGLHGWHIDHIRPCASFDLTDPEQQKQCFHYTNLQPLWAEENLRKGDKYEKTS